MNCGVFNMSPSTDSSPCIAGGEPDEDTGLEGESFEKAIIRSRKTIINIAIIRVCQLRMIVVGKNFLSLCLPSVPFIGTTFFFVSRP
jgi:hypothetical protein